MLCFKIFELPHTTLPNQDFVASFVAPIFFFSKITLFLYFSYNKTRLRVLLFII